MGTTKLFELHRHEDESGVSGTGIVAKGAIFEDGTAVMRWLTEHRSTAIYTTVEELDAIHGHGGKTEVVIVEESKLMEKYERQVAYDKLRIAELENKLNEALWESAQFAAALEDRGPFGLLELKKRADKTLSDMADRLVRVSLQTAAEKIRKEAGDDSHEWTSGIRLGMNLAASKLDAWAEEE